jgi:hypothetical protein
MLDESLDVADMAKRLGPDHGCMNWDLVIYCHECRAAGRDDRNLPGDHERLTHSVEYKDMLAPMVARPMMKTFFASKRGSNVLRVKRSMAGWRRTC